MKIVFLSNFYNHHQRPLADALAGRAEYTFIATSAIPEERKNLGWGGDAEPAYVCHYDAEPERAEKALSEADLVIAGSAPEKLVQNCIRQGVPVFRYHERPLKKGPELKKYLPRLVKWHLLNPPGRKIWMLCASGYTAGDYARFVLFRGRAFRWGYFPEMKRYDDIDALLERKRRNRILWAGRFLDWKHPDDAVRAAAKLKASGRDFEMLLIGTGEMENVLQEMIRREGLEDRVLLPGPMKPEEVRIYMEEAGIFLFTSDRQEGWGAVLNEAMNSGCAVIAGHEAGSVPFLLRDGENGLVYPSGDADKLADKIARLLEHPDEQRRLGRKAYETITEEWCAGEAAERLIRLAETLLAGGKSPYTEGPCSPAEELREDWYKG